DARTRGVREVLTGPFCGTTPGSCVEERSAPRTQTSSRIDDLLRRTRQTKTSSDLETLADRLRRQRTQPGPQPDDDARPGQPHAGTAPLGSPERRAGHGDIVTMPSPSLRDPRLDTLYTPVPRARSHSSTSPTARTRSPGSERPFYAMSAVTFAKEQRDHVREVLTDIAGGRYWHTSEAFKLGRPHDITAMGQYLAERVEWSIVTVEATITARGGLPEARQTCLAAAAREVTRGAGPDAV